MCGIAGIVLGRPRARAEGEALIARMTDVLAHRGPDARGTWCDGDVLLGHRRLSIIDLTAAGCQPMRDPTGRYTLVYNGEVYNYRELRRELEGRGYRFRSSTDSEVVLYAYAEWGGAALDRFNGMWAFAIWDAERRELFGARDRAGKKPFYYARDERGTFYFASEIKALRAAGLRMEMSPQAVFDFLTQGTYGHIEGESFLATVRQLPPAHSLRVRPGTEPRLARYWSLPVVAERDRLPYDDVFKRRFREILSDAVRLRLRADVAVGATLSGGLDSSTLVAMADVHTGGAPLHIFTSQFPGSVCDESAYFDAVVRRLRHPVVHHVGLDDADLRADLDALLEHQEEPFGDTSIYAHFRLMRAARDAGVRVILSGQGGDELLMGYSSMIHAYLGSLLARGRVRTMLREVDGWRRDGAETTRAHVLRAAAFHAIPLPLRDRVRRLWVRRAAGIVTPRLRAQASSARFAGTGGRTSLDAYLAQIFTRFSIPHLTHYDDRNAMAFGVEGRMPFLDHRLVELVFAVRYEALFHDGYSKRVLREACADLLPDIVRTRRDKIGFYTPLAALLRRNWAWVEEVMTPERIAHYGVLDAARYGRRAAAFRAGDNSAELEVWRGFIFHLWADRFGVAAQPAAHGRGSGRAPVAPQRAAS